jgi:hypothetical protein
MLVGYIIDFLKPKKMIVNLFGLFLSSRTRVKKNKIGGVVGGGENPTRALVHGAFTCRPLHHGPVLNKNITMPI